MAQDLSRVKRNVAKMVSMNAPESDIDAYITQEGTTVDAIRSFKPSAGISVGVTGTKPVGSTVVLEQPKPVENTGTRELKIQAEGLARGVGSFPEFVEDVASIPGRTLGGVQAIAGDILGSKEMRRQGERVFFAPSKLNTGQQLGRAVGRAIGAPTDLKAGERARQEGAAFAGQLATGGLLRGGVQAAGRQITQQAPRVAQALQAAANSRAARFVAPSRPADLATAYGAGVGTEYVNQLSDGNALMAVPAGIATGLAAGILARTSGAGLTRATNVLRPNTGVGASLVGEAGKNVQVNPEQRFGQLSGAVRKAAANAETQLNSKYRIARELSAGSVVTPQGITDLRTRIVAMIQGTADTEQRALHESVLRNFDDLVRSKNGNINMGDIAENVRRQYSTAGANKAFAKGEGVRSVDAFVEEAVSNPNLVNGMGAKAGQAWKEAISFARDKYTKFDDPADIARILAPEAGTNKTITAAQVGEMFVPSGRGSNLTNKWTTVLEALPPTERKFMNQTIKSGIIHNALKRSQQATPEGFMIDEKKFSENLAELISDPVFAKRFTKQEQDAIRKAQAELTRTVFTSRNFPKVFGAIMYALSGQGFGATKMGAEGLVGPATANLDDIIRVLERPIPLRSSQANTVGAITVPIATQQTSQTQPVQIQNPVLMPSPQDTVPMAPTGRMSYSQAKQRVGLTDE